MTPSMPHHSANMPKIYVWEWQACHHKFNLTNLIKDSKWGCDQYLVSSKYCTTEQNQAALSKRIKKLIASGYSLYGHHRTDAPTQVYPASMIC